MRLAPVAAPTLLALYVDDPVSLADAMGFYPADEGANVALLRPYDTVVWERTTIDRDDQYVAPSQAAVDCLTGTGRMPAEGEALLGWMAEHEPSWRRDALVGTG